MALPSFAELNQKTGLRASVYFCLMRGHNLIIIKLIRRKQGGGEEQRGGGMSLPDAFRRMHVDASNGMRATSWQSSPVGTRVLSNSGIAGKGHRRGSLTKSTIADHRWGQQTNAGNTFFARSGEGFNGLGGFRVGTTTPSSGGGANAHQFGHAAETQADVRESHFQPTDADAGCLDLRQHHSREGTDTASHREAMSPTVTSMFGAMQIPSIEPDGGAACETRGVAEGGGESGDVEDQAETADRALYESPRGPVVPWRCVHGDAGMVIPESSEVEYDGELAFLLERNTLGPIEDEAMDFSLSYIS